MLKKISLIIAVFCIFSNFALAQQKTLRNPDSKAAAIKSFQAQVANKNKVITLTLKNASIKQALRMLADKASINIVFQDSIRERVTLDLKHVSVSDAFEQIAEISNLNYKMKNNTLVVTKKTTSMPIAYEQPVEIEPQVKLQEIRTVKVNYANAIEVSDFLNQNLTEDQNAIAIAQGLNEVILVGSKNVVEKSEELISKLDVKPKVAIFKLNYINPCKMAQMICSGIFNGNCNIGKNGSFSQKVHPYSVSYDLNDNSLTFTGITEAQIKLIKDYIKYADVKSPQAVLDILMVELSEEGVARLKEFNKIMLNSRDGIEYGIGKTQRSILDNVAYIATNSGGKILARPKITISNASKYEVALTSDYVESKKGTNVYNIAKDCGIDLKLCSLISPKNEIILNLEPTYRSVKQFIPNEKRPRATLLNRKSIKLNNIRLNNCETLAVGGMVSQRIFKKGFLGSKKEVKNVEFMIFINAHIVK